MFYIVVGYQFDQDDNYDCLLGEDRGAITIVHNESPDVEYRDYVNRADHGRLCLKATNPPAASPALPKVMVADLKYPNTDGQVSNSEEEPENPEDVDCTRRYVYEFATDIGSRARSFFSFRFDRYEKCFGRSRISSTQTRRIAI
jgi:hypothetical protein